MDAGGGVLPSFWPMLEYVMTMTRTDGEYRKQTQIPSARNAARQCVIPAKIET